jgi:hypothetical protein
VLKVFSVDTIIVLVLWKKKNPPDHQRKAAFDALYKTDASIPDKVDKAINLNAWKAWDPPATQETNDLYNQLNGMSATDREAFSKLRAYP